MDATMKQFKKEFALNQRVMMSDYMGAELNGAIGTILGKSFDHIFDMYIVLLDKPLQSHLAVVIPEMGITAITE